MAKWSIRNASIWGATLGVAYILATTLYRGAPRLPAEWVGLLIGGAIGGVILFVVVAAIRNAFART